VFQKFSLYQAAQMYFPLEMSNIKDKNL